MDLNDVIAGCNEDGLFGTEKFLREVQAAMREAADMIYPVLSTNDVASDMCDKLRTLAGKNEA